MSENPGQHPFAQITRGAAEVAKTLRPILLALEPIRQPLHQLALALDPIRSYLLLHGRRGEPETLAAIALPAPEGHPERRRIGFRI